MKQLARLGNVADVANSLTLVYEEAEEAVHAALREAVYGGLVLRQDSTPTPFCMTGSSRRPIR